MPTDATAERQLLATRLIRRANKGLRIKQTTLAEDLGRDQSTINRWIKFGVPEDGVDAVLAWAHTHGVDLPETAPEAAHKMRSIDVSESAQPERLSPHNHQEEVGVLTDADRALLKIAADLSMADGSFRRDLLQFVRQRRWLPLSAAGVAALKAFIAAKATGPFSASAVHKSWRLACVKAGVTNARPYDLKHSFGTLLYQASHDLAAVARLLDVSLTTAQRYTLGAHETVDRAVVGRISGGIDPATSANSRKP